jgi:hypothetical protein
MLARVSASSLVGTVGPQHCGPRRSPRIRQAWLASRRIRRMTSRDHAVRDHAGGRARLGPGRRRSRRPGLSGSSRARQTLDSCLGVCLFGTTGFRLSLTSSRQGARFPAIEVRFDAPAGDAQPSQIEERVRRARSAILRTSLFNHGTNFAYACLG